jgi:hypothetical protein
MARVNFVSRPIRTSTDHHHTEDLFLLLSDLLLAAPFSLDSNIGDHGREPAACTRDRVTIASPTGLCELRLQVRRADRSSVLLAFNIGIYHRLPSSKIVYLRKESSHLLQHLYRETFLRCSTSS